MSVHPDDEALSAHLDGEAPEWESHVRSCPSCQARLAAFGRVAAAVGTAPPALRPGGGDDAVARALAVARPAPSWRSRRLVVAAAGIAAAVLVAGGVAALVGRSGSSSSKFAAASRRSGPVASNFIEAGDIGDLADDKTLKARVEPSLFATEAGASAAAPAPAAGGAAPQTSGQPSAKSDALRSAAAAGPLPCEAKARALQPGAQVLVYRASARWQGTPAVVFGFTAASPTPTRPSGKPSPTRVYVMARSGCRLLVFQSYAP